MKIIFCHHAQRKKGNPSTQNDGLTDFGVKDAKLQSILLSQLQNVKAIYTSPFYRCFKTAQILNKKLNVPIFKENRFNEFKSIENETWVVLQKRVISAINDIFKKYNDNDVVICITSGVNVGAFFLWNFNLKPNKDLPFIGISSCSPIMFQKSNGNKKELKFWREHNCTNFTSITPTRLELETLLIEKVKEKTEKIKLIENCTTHMENLETKKLRLCADLLQLIDDLTEYYGVSFTKNVKPKNYTNLEIYQNILNKISKLNVKNCKTILKNIYVLILSYIKNLNINIESVEAEKLNVLQKDGSYIKGKFVLAD